MDRNLESIIQLPAMKMANEARARLDSLSYATGSLANLSKVLNDLDPAKRLVGHTANQDLLSQLSQTLPQNNLVIYNSIAEMVKSFTESNPLNTRLFESVKFNKTIMEAFESIQLGLKPQTQFILPEGFTSKNQIGDLNSIIFKATEIFKQFSGLTSFKALSRLDNFPFKDMIPINSNSLLYLKVNINEDVVELDSEISKELSLTDDFNELSEERRTLLLNLYQSYYYPIIFNYSRAFIKLIQ